MNDPHVVALYYSVKHAEQVNYNKAPRLDHDQPKFTLRVESDRAEITMKAHYATAEEARAEVEPYLGVWELTAALQFRPGEFGFAYVNADVIDRDPTPGLMGNWLLAASASLTAKGEVHVGRSRYPDPPPAGIALDASVELMLNRYYRYCEGTTTLADAGYFCLTMLENSSSRRRAGAARRYAIAKAVLGKLGDLTATKGGREARKAAGSDVEFTAAERHWIEEAIKRLIHRAAEVAGDPSASRQKITMADLPTLP